MENKRYDQLSSAAISRNIEFASMLRKSQLKESQIIMEVCCSRHNQCIIGNNQSPSVQNDSISVDSDLLREVEPKDVSCEPVFQYQNKPEIDMLAKINIKKKQYQKMMETYEKQLKEQEKKQKIQKVNKQAKIALEHSKKTAQTKKSKWGHSIFQTKVEEKNEQKKEQQIKREKQEKSKQKKKVQLKDINERITEYKQNELRKARSAQNFKKVPRQKVNVEECNQKIKENADKILQKMKEEKDKVLQEKKIVQAKIRAIQLQSLKKVTNCQKKPLPEGEFELGDSQYSTFQARAAGRKLQKKKKKVKQKLAGPTLLDTKKSKPSKQSTRKQKSLKKDVEKTVPRNKVEEEQPPVKEQAKKQEIKGPFYVWNMPIMPEDIQKLQKPSKEVFMNVDRFNYKQGKTFREQANQYLAQKMQKRFQQARTEAKQHMFFVEVEKKKQKLDQEFEKQNNPIMNEPVWSEDQLFRPNILQNFHFFPKEDS